VLLDLGKPLLVAELEDVGSAEVDLDQPHERSVSLQEVDRLVQL